MTRSGRARGRHAAGSGHDQPEVLGALFEHGDAYGPDAPHFGPGDGLTEVAAERQGPSRAVAVALVALGVFVVLAVLGVSIFVATGGSDGSPHPQAVIEATGRLSAPAASPSATESVVEPVLPSLTPAPSTSRSTPTHTAATAAAAATAATATSTSTSTSRSPSSPQPFVGAPPVDALPTFKRTGPAGATGSRSPRPSTSVSTSAPAPGQVQAQRAARYRGAGCPRRCFYLEVVVGGFPAGQHNVQCVDAATGGVLASITTAATDLPQACWGAHHESVYVVVDGRSRSRTVVL